MFIVLKKKSLYILFIVVITFSLIILSGYGIKTKLAGNDKFIKQKIIIDAGHGEYAINIVVYINQKNNRTF